jgi:DNA processing protein
MQNISLIKPRQFPPLLKEITDPPEHLYVEGTIDPLLDSTAKILCVVGSRRYSHYGKEATQKLIAGLRGYNVCIISGLALGIDSIAHRAALDAGLYTAAFPGSGLDPSVLYPQSHKKLAREIVQKGGALISEFDMTMPPLPHTFPQRNRLMAGISHATLVIECGLVSGTLITSARASDYNRDVGAVPGSIFSPHSEGPHMLISKGATPVASTDDLLELLGFARRNGQSRLPLGEDPRFKALPDLYKKVLRYLERGSRNRDQLVRELFIHPKILNMVLTSLEIEGFIKELGGVVLIK